jgi:hypothetical protein
MLRFVLMTGVLTLTTLHGAIAEDSRTVQLRSGAKTDTSPVEKGKRFSLISKEPGRAVLKAVCDEIRVKRCSFKSSGVYDVIEIEGGILGTGEIGSPDLPVCTEEIRIPPGTKPRLVVDKVVFTDVEGVYEVAPVQEPMPDLSGFDESKIRFRKNEKAYACDEFGTDPVVTLVETVRIRGKEYARVEFRPVKYNPAKKTVRVATDAEWHLEYTPVRPEKRRNDNQPAPAGSALDIRTDSDILPEGAGTLPESGSDQGAAPAAEAGASSAQACDYLIICHDNYLTQIQPLADWRTRTGFKVYVAGYPSAVGSGQNNIFNYIKNAYSSGVMTRYVLIVGDHENIPAWTITGHPYHGTNHVWHSDLKYACVDGTDDYPDLALGRFPCDTAAQVTLMVNRVLTYEKNPPSGTWIKHMVGAGQDDRWFEEDIHRVCDFMGGDFDFFGSWNGYSGTDPFNKGYTTHVAVNAYMDPYRSETYTLRLQPPTPTPSKWKANGTAGATQISGWINTGAGFVMHRDHGSTSGWGTPSYSSSNVGALTNRQKTPVVFSINCLTGQFDDGDNFGEAWVRNANGGAVAFFGHQRVSYSGANDTLHVGIMDSIWSDYSSWSSSVYSRGKRCGELLNYAKHAVGFGSGTPLLTARMLHLFGDPAMEFRAETPKQLSATHPSSLSTTATNSFTVKVTASGNNVQGATVCLTDSDEQYVKVTDSNGNAAFSIKPGGLDTMFVTVTASESIPYQGSMSKTGTAQTNGAAYISQVVPTTMIAGTVSNVTVKMKNTGTSTWSPAEAQKLGSLGDSNTWGVTRVYLTGSVAPNQTNTFSFSITAPTTPGTYSFQWRMVDDEGSNIGWFGANSALQTITVASGSTTKTSTFYSVGVHDGYVDESSETSNVGGTNSATLTSGTALRVGDTGARKQRKSIVSFDTSTLPDAAVVTAATLKLKRGGGIGTPTGLGVLTVDIKNVSAGFGTSLNLENIDFEAAASSSSVGTLSYPATTNAWATAVLNTNGTSRIAKTNYTQFRIRFATDDDNDTADDYLGFYSGENASATNRPILEVTYQ